MSQSPQYALDLSGHKPEVCQRSPNGAWTPCVEPSQDSVEPWKDLARFVKVAQSKKLQRPSVPVLLPRDHVLFQQIDMPADDRDLETHALAVVGGQIDEPPSQLMCHAKQNKTNAHRCDVAIVAKATLAEAESIALSLGFEADGYSVNTTNAPVFALPQRQVRVTAPLAVAASVSLITLVGLAGYLALPNDKTLMAGATWPGSIDAARDVAQAGVIDTDFVTEAAFPETHASANVHLASMTLPVVQTRKTQVATVAPRYAQPEHFASAMPLGDTVTPIHRETTRAAMAFGPQLAALETTTEGVTTPEGVTVHNERPSIVPPARTLSSEIVRPRLRGSSNEQPAATSTRPVAAPPNDEAPTVMTTPPPNPAAPIETPSEAAAVAEPLPSPHPAHTALKPRLRGGADSQVAAATPPATDTIAPEQAEVTAKTNIDAADAAPTEPQPLPSPALADKRPLPRPSTLDQSATVNLLALASPSHRGKRAKPRPNGLGAAPAPQPEPVIAAPAPPPAPVLTEQQIAEDIRKRAEAARQARLAQSSRLAVRLSPVPRKKSSSFTRTVSKTNANIKQASLTPQAAPNPGNSSRKGTTSTFSKNTLSLVGVYGTSSARRALIRTSTGRYVKVKHGQRVAGWRVSAIGANTVRVTRGSRTRTLRLP